MNAVLKSATGLDNSTEITSRLLAPLGISSYYLGKEEYGVLGDIELTPRDMMKLGELYLQKGKWNGREIVPHTWVTESTSTKIAARPGLGYGYFWWTRDFNWKGTIVRSFFAWGYGGQYIFVIPDLQLVVTLTGSHWTTDPKNHVMEMMENYIVPSCE
jgi:CubicO group peptidase (beta-lactamase class C family)